MTGIISLFNSLSWSSFLIVLYITSKSFFKVFQLSLKPITPFIYGKHFFKLAGKVRHSSGNWLTISSAIFKTLEAE